MNVVESYVSFSAQIDLCNFSILLHFVELSLLQKTNHFFFLHFRLAVDLESLISEYAYEIVAYTQ